MATFAHTSFVNHDDYMTPKAAWEDILEYIPRDKIIWESFYGDGSSGGHLRELGLNTFHQPIDFFTEEPDQWDIIVSNPPFTLIKPILKKLFEFDKPFILIMPSSKINTQYFREWKDKGIQIIIPKKRIPQEKDSFHQAREWSYSGGLQKLVQFRLLLLLLQGRT